MHQFLHVSERDRVAIEFGPGSGSTSLASDRPEHAERGRHRVRAEADPVGAGRDQLGGERGAGVDHQADGTTNPVGQTTDQRRATDAGDDGWSRTPETCSLLAAT